MSGAESCVGFTDETPATSEPTDLWAATLGTGTILGVVVWTRVLPWIADLLRLPMIPA